VQVTISDLEKNAVKSSEERSQKPDPCLRRFMPLGTALRSDAHRTGVRIRATTTESSMDAMMVTENWR